MAELVDARDLKSLGVRPVRVRFPPQALDFTSNSLPSIYTDDTNQSAGYFVPDADPLTTTDPTNPDSDGDGLSDGEEDINKNGAVDEKEPGFSLCTPIR